MKLSNVIHLRTRITKAPSCFLHSRSPAFVGLSQLSRHSSIELRSSGVMHWISFRPVIECTQDRGHAPGAIPPFVVHSHLKLSFISMSALSLCVTIRRRGRDHSFQMWSRVMRETMRETLKSHKVVTPDGAARVLLQTFE